MLKEVHEAERKTWVCRKELKLVKLVNIWVNTMIDKILPKPPKQTKCLFFLASSLSLACYYHWESYTDMWYLHICLWYLPVLKTFNCSVYTDTLLRCSMPDCCTCTFYVVLAWVAHDFDCSTLENTLCWT